MQVLILNFVACVQGSAWGLPDPQSQQGQDREQEEAVRREERGGGAPEAHGAGREGPIGEHQQRIEQNCDPIETRQQRIEQYCVSII